MQLGAIQDCIFLFYSDTWWRVLLVNAVLSGEKSQKILKYLFVS
jgi:hypothetical protein